VRGLFCFVISPAVIARSRVKGDSSKHWPRSFPEIQVISSDQYAGTAPDAALDKATDVLNKYADRVTGICAVCEPNAAGLLGALENTRLSGKVNAVVFDPNSTLIKGLAEGKLQQVTNSARSREQLGPLSQAYLK
jgi:ABC-type sugar transport system substrate-binding protein